MVYLKIHEIGIICHYVQIAVLDEVDQKLLKNLLYVNLIQQTNQYYKKW